MQNTGRKRTKTSMKKEIRKSLTPQQTNTNNLKWVHIPKAINDFNHCNYNPMEGHKEYEELKEMRKMYDTGVISADEYYSFVNEHNLLKAAGVVGGEKMYEVCSI